MLTLACLRAGIVPVMALPAHRRTSWPTCAARRGPGHRHPDRLRDFDHQDPRPRTRRRRPRCSPAGRGTSWSRGSTSRPPAWTCAPCARPGARSGRRRCRTAQPDVAVFLLSGGTTGLPKLIPRTHDDYVYNARASARAVPARRRRRLSRRAARGAQLPAGLPRHPRGRSWSAAASSCCAAPEPGAGLRRRSRPSGSPSPRWSRRCGQRWLDHAGDTVRAQLATLRVLQVGGSRLADELAPQVRPMLGLHAAAGLRDGRGTAELHPPRRPRRRRSAHPGPTAVPRRRGPRRRRPSTRTSPTASRARCSPAGRTPPAATTRPPEQNARPSPRTAGTAPATSCRRTPRATSSSRAATRT